MIYQRGKYWHMDVMVDGVRYREALGTTDRREARAKEKDRIAEIKAGRIAAPAGRAFSRLPFVEAAKVFQDERGGKVAERTMQFEKERLKPLKRYFGVRVLRTIKRENIVAYQRGRISPRVSGTTVNMETDLLQRILKRAKLFAVLADFPKRFPEHEREIGTALPVEQKTHLFQVAGSKPDWMVAHCAAVLAASTTCRGVELKNLRWRDVDLYSRVLNVNRSKRESGRRAIPLNGDAVAALARLWERAQASGAADPDHYVFPACENGHIDPTRHQKTWRTAWRSLTKAAGLKGFRFHDLRHQAVTELSEAGASDAAIMAIAGHLSRRMLEHYSHVRMAAKRTAVEKLESGLMTAPAAISQPQSRPVN